VDWFALLAADSGREAFRSSRSAVLVANEFDFLRALNGDSCVVFLDGPPPALRFEDDVRVMHGAPQGVPQGVQTSWFHRPFVQLQIVQRISVIGKTSSIFSDVSISVPSLTCISSFLIEYSLPLGESTSA
jgi:hypothetical protein